MKLAPEQQQVEMTFRIPEPIMNGVVAGAGFGALEKTRIRRWVWDVPFEALGRALDAMWEEAKVRLTRALPLRERR